MSQPEVWGIEMTDDEAESFTEAVGGERMEVLLGNSYNTGWRSAAKYIAQAIEDRVGGRAVRNDMTNYEYGYLDGRRDGMQEAVRIAREESE